MRHLNFSQTMGESISRDIEQGNVTVKQLANFTFRQNYCPVRLQNDHTTIGKPIFAVAACKELLDWHLVHRSP